MSTVPRYRERIRDTRPLWAKKRLWLPLGLVATSLILVIMVARSTDPDRSAPAGAKVHPTPLLARMKPSPTALDVQPGQSLGGKSGHEVRLIGVTPGEVDGKLNLSVQLRNPQMRALIAKILTVKVRQSDRVIATARGDVSILRADGDFSRRLWTDVEFPQNPGTLKYQVELD